MSKYRIEDVPRTQPGKCANCGASKNDGRRYVDFGLLVDWYGTVYLCGECLHDVASEMGLFNDLEQELAEVKERVQSGEALSEEGVRIYSALVSDFEGLKAYYADLHSVRDDTIPDTGVVLDTDTSSNESRVDSTEPISNEPERRVVKSSSSSRSKNVPSLAELIKQGSNE